MKNYGDTLFLRVNQHKMRNRTKVRDISGIQVESNHLYLFAPCIQVPMYLAALKEKNRLFRPPDLPAGNGFGPSG